MLLNCRGYLEKVHMTESKPEYPILKSDEVAKVPVILEGLVIRNGAPASPVQKSPVDGSWDQLWKGRVRVENVLQGQVHQPEVDVFYFIGDIPGSARRIQLRSGERNIFFLRRDGKHLRTSNDRSANASLLKVLTGPHLNFKRAPGISINEAIMRLLLTRGRGVDDKQMIAEIEEGKYSRFVGEAQIVSTLELVARRETPIVREAACAELVSLQHPCGYEDEGPTVTVENLTRPGSGAIFHAGDRVRTTLTAAAHQPVYRSGGGPLGMTDASGHFTQTDAVRVQDGDTRTDVWNVGTEEMSPAITYFGGLRGSGGEIIPTAIGNARDRHGMGLSALCVSGNTVVTYSAMLLDYRTALYYDAEEQDTLFESEKPIRTGKISGAASAHQLWETKVTSWNDYNLAAAHYAVAAFKGGTFANPVKFSQGSCYGPGSNCQIVPLDGPAHLAKPPVLLGTTGANQTAVPQDIGWMLKDLDPESKARVLDLLLTRGEGATDDWMIEIIDGIVKEHQFGDDLVASKLREVAERETPRVRAKACTVLRALKQPCPKRSRQGENGDKPVVVEKKTKPANVTAPEPERLRTAIPTYQVFAHFLLMTNELGVNKAAAAFQLQWVGRNQLQALENEAAALSRELGALDIQAKRVTGSFRTAGALALALAEARPLPPVPTEICVLQAMRIAVMVNHTIHLQLTLGPKNAARFEGVLAYSFAR